MTCKHEQFDAKVAVARLEDTGQFNAEVRINCLQCGTPFEFQGLPAGLDLAGATVSVDGQEARLAICPAGEKPNPFHRMRYGVQGFNG